MNKAIIGGGIIGGIAVISVILGIVFSSELDVAKVEDNLDKEIQPAGNPKIQEKLDEIKKITNSTEYKSLDREWQTSGPFQIDRKEYAIGEKIFIRIGGLQYLEKGQIAVMMPLNATHQKVYLTIPFDESKKGEFNYYLEPEISQVRGICSTDDLIGKWTLVFRGTNYQKLNFEIIDKVVPGTNIEPVC